MPGGRGQRSWGPKDWEFGENETENSEVGARCAEGEMSVETQGAEPGPGQCLCRTDCPDREEEEEGGLGRPSLRLLFMGASLPLSSVCKPGLGMESECPSQLPLPAITRLTSLLSGKWCFD